MKRLNTVTVKTGTVTEFMDNMRNAMRIADAGGVIPPSRTLVFEEPLDMLQFLTDTKIKLINTIREHPGSITNIAKATKRHRSSVYRDLHKMEKFGLIKIYEKINPGHGRHKIVKLTASKLKLESSI